MLRLIRRLYLYLREAMQQRAYRHRPPRIIPPGTAKQWIREAWEEEDHASSDDAPS